MNTRQTYDENKEKWNYNSVLELINVQPFRAMAQIAAVKILEKIQRKLPWWSLSFVKL